MRPATGAKAGESPHHPSGGGIGSALLARSVRPCVGHCGSAAAKMAEAFGDELFSVFEEDAAAAASGAKKSKTGPAEGARRPG